MTRAVLLHEATSPPDFWNLSFDVYPTIRGASAEVMLVQSLLIGCFMNSFVNSDRKMKAIAIISRFGPRFGIADGIYGQATREVMRLFEEDVGAQYKDGVVRHASVGVITGGPGAPKTKLYVLNFVWNHTMVGSEGGPLASSKRESGERLLPLALFNDLYADPGHLYY